MGKGLFGGLFDLNGDGKLSPMEQALDFMAFNELLNDDEDDTASELEDAGLDEFELSLMEEEERNEILEDADLDPNDFDF